MKSSLPVILPFLIFLFTGTLLTLVIATVSLFVDLRKIQQEQQEDLGTIWYQQPKIHRHLKWIGRSLFLLLFVGAFTFCLTAHVPLWLLVISEAGIGFIGVGSRLIFDLIKVQQSPRRRVQLVWYRQPQILKRMGKSARFIGLLLMFGVGAYEQAQGFPGSHFLWDTIIGIGGPAILLLLSLILFICANALQKTKQT
ncbi:MAG TPA: hypothetical protein VKY19_21545 [Ktedonosporobacter sp.]|jgi:hypothetical protein|nr:hypothetical protein [Ktedonosporobacter sp.]